MTNADLPPNRPAGSDSAAIDRLSLLLESVIETQNNAFAQQNTILRVLLEEQRNDREEQRRDREEQRKEREEQRRDREEQRKEREEQKTTLNTFLEAQNKALNQIADSQQVILTHIAGTVQPEINEPAAILGADTFQTPTKSAVQRAAQSAVLSAALSAVQDAGPIIPFPSEEYKKFGKALDELTEETQLLSILGLLGGNWLTRWESAEAGEGIFASAAVQDIIDKCLADCRAERSTVKSGLEHNYQLIISSLAKQIEATLRDNGTEHGVYWSDRHNSPMPDASKPDGLLMFR
ncbi:hypothetical protein LPJ59_006444, partial [Coemansia sp. RSA 2399]